MILVKIPLGILERSVGQFFRRPLPEIYSIYGQQYIGTALVIAFIYVVMGYFHLYLTIYCLTYVFDILLDNNQWLYSSKDNMLINLKNHFENDTLQLNRLRAGDKGINSKILLIYILMWVFIYFIILKGVRTNKMLKFILVSSIYIALLITLINILTLPGSIDGIKYLITPRFDRIFSMQTWKEAIDQNYFQSILEHSGLMTGAIFKNKSSKLFRTTYMLHNKHQLWRLWCVYYSINYNFCLFRIL